MGLPTFPSPAEGVLPLLVMKTAMSVAAVKNMLRSMLQVGGASGGAANQDSVEDTFGDCAGLRTRRVSITQYGSLCRNRCMRPDRTHGGSGSGSGSGRDGDGNIWPSTECCVCLCKFQADEEVSELSCKHFFHKGCLEKWLDNQHTTCPLCRSIL